MISRIIQKILGVTKFIANISVAITTVMKLNFFGTDEYFCGSLGGDEFI
jgi:hypothetical protein